MRISKKERGLIAKVREAVEFAANGDPMRDAIEEDEIREALELLIKILDRKPELRDPNAGDDKEGKNA